MADAINTFAVAPPVGGYGSCTFAFQAEADDELDIIPGDVIKVLAQEDSDWQKGELVRTSQHGIYPTEFATALETARARDDYTSSEEGDLTFAKGDTIVLTSRIDRDWVKGVSATTPPIEGMFPRDFVDILGPGVSAPPQPYARCAFEFFGQASDELTIFPEDVVYLLHKLSDEWYEGICFGQRGIVPASFLDVIEEAPLKPSDTTSGDSNAVPVRTAGSNSSAQASAKPLTLSPPKPPPPSAKSKPAPPSTVKKPPPPLKKKPASPTKVKKPPPPSAVKKPCLPPPPTMGKPRTTPPGATSKRPSQPAMNTKPPPPPKAKRASAPTTGIPPKPATAPPPAPTTVRPAPRTLPPSAKPRPPAGVASATTASVLEGAPVETSSAEHHVAGVPPPKPMPPPQQTKPALPPAGADVASPPPTVTLHDDSGDPRRLDEAGDTVPLTLPQGARKPRPEPPSRRASNVMAAKRRSRAPTGAPTVSPATGSTLTVVQPQTATPPERPRSIANRSDLDTAGTESSSNDGREELEQEIEALEREVENAAEKHMGLDALLAHMRTSSDFDAAACAATEDQLATAHEHMDSLETKLVHLYSKRGKRAKIVAEIFDTEQDLSGDLRLCVRGYLGAKSPLRKVLSDAEFTKLFCNMEELAGVADALAADVRRESLKAEGDQMLGQVFCHRAQQLQETYVKYVVNFDDATELLHEINGNPRVKERLQRCHASIADKTKCWDLSSILIKPVQRILKYPLLLRELAKKTPADHADYADIVQAETLLSKIGTAINEGRRTKEILEKYSASGDGKKARNPHGIMHTISKKSIRIKQRVTRRSNVADFEEYNDYVKTFTEMEAACKKLRKRCDEYLAYKNTTALALSEYSNAVFEFFFSKDYRVGEVFPPETRHKDTQLICDTLKRIEKHTHTYVETVRKIVVAPKGPLDRLLQGFANPQRLIAKRADKQLDYESFKRKYQAAAKDEERQRSMKAEMGVVENTFQALHLKLMTDLPMTIQLYQQALRAMLRMLVDAHTTLARSCLAECTRVPQHTFEDVTTTHAVEARLRATLVPVVQDLLDKQTAYGLRDLAAAVGGAGGVALRRRTSASSAGSVAPSGREDTGTRVQTAPSTAPRGVRLSNGGAATVAAEPESGTPASPFGNAVCRWEFEAMSETEISVSPGDDVVILSRSDDTGNSEWYLVQLRDGRSGFVPADFLDEEGENAVDDAGTIDNDVDDTEPDEALPPLVLDVLGTANVLYEFEAGADIELTVKQGDVCEVLAMMDPSGNDEWCLLRNASGAEGYVPVNFVAVDLTE
eukprot:m.989012 g.989012  ORF g.989012 m.989012 type:complete len:1298 (+) comp23995_c0_seq6:220-4113(+)